MINLSQLLWLKGLLWLMGLLWRAGLPRVGLRSSPKTGDGALPDTPRQPYGGCYAAQRGASPLATISPLATGHLPARWEPHA